MAKKFLAQRLEGIKGMNYAPVNEQGVVYLFALLANKLGFKGIEKNTNGIPRCVGTPSSQWR